MASQVLVLGETGRIGSKISAALNWRDLTWRVVRLWHPKLLKSRQVIESLARISYAITQISDRFSRIEVAMRCVSTMLHSNTACAAGIGTGTIAELLLSGTLKKPGVWTPEQAVSALMFEVAMQSRGVAIQQQLLPNSTVICFNFLSL